MRNAWIWIVVVVVILVGGFIWWQNSQSSAGATMPVTETPIDNTATGASTDSSSTDTGTTGTPGTTAVQSYTAAQVATHKDASSCWSIIDNNVYDLTSWIPQHPGGQQAIKGLCGKDGTAMFHGQHGDAKRQADILATMKIGALAQ